MVEGLSQSHVSGAAECDYPNLVPVVGKVMENVFDYAGFVPVVGTVTGSIRLALATMVGSIEIVAGLFFACIGYRELSRSALKEMGYSVLQIFIGASELIPFVKIYCHSRGIAVFSRSPYND